MQSTEVEKLYDEREPLPTAAEKLPWEVTDATPMVAFVTKDGHMTILNYSSLSSANLFTDQKILLSFSDFNVVIHVKATIEKINDLRKAFQRHKIFEITHCDTVLIEIEEVKKQ